VPVVEGSPVDGLILGVDLDGVCADFYAAMRQIAAEYFERDIEELTTAPSYGLQEWGVEGKIQYESLHRFAVLQRDLFRNAPLIPGARKYLRMLSYEGARIRIITHRLYLYFLHRVSVEQTVEWLDYHAIPYWDLCFMRDKEQVGADIYLDDSPDNVVRLREAGFYTICFGNSTNTHLAAPRAESWQHAYELIHERASNIKAPRGA
jgi:5'(3')-deoxyribonucleotidase